LRIGKGESGVFLVSLYRVPTKEAEPDFLFRLEMLGTGNSKFLKSVHQRWEFAEPGSPTRNQCVSGAIPYAERGASSERIREEEMAQRSRVSWIFETPVKCVAGHIFTGK